MAVADASDKAEANGTPMTQDEEASPEQHATPDSNELLTNGAETESSKENGEAGDSAPAADNVFQLTIHLPHAPWKSQIMVSSQEQVQDIKQSIMDPPHTSQYSCFHLEHKGKRINDFIELSEVADIVQEPECKLVEDPYTEALARTHILRVRELTGAAGDRTDLLTGVDAGKSLCDGIGQPSSSNEQDNENNPVAKYEINTPGSLSVLVPKARDPPPKTIKSLSLSAWNPPPYHLRMRGQLLYIQVTTLEGEQYYITSAVSGFYVNKSTNQKFDPAPRSAPKSFSAHSLLTLLGQISPSFEDSFRKLQQYHNEKDPLASYALSNSIPSAPWLVPLSSVQQHQPDLTRTQEPLLLAGADAQDTLRDWNEEFQSTRELPKETVQDRVFRERLTSKLFAEYTEAAVKGAVLVARGEVQPLNPTEARDAQIFVYNNVFYSFGADGVGTFTSDGGDEAARVATGKDVQGVRAVNQLDINGLFTAGTVVVDYLGKRIVGQSIVPGIFKQREPGEHQIDYGGVEGKDVIASLDSFVQPFSELSKATRVKRHAVWDKEGKKHELEASVETKGLVGTDGRKYVLDLYRLTPLDIEWLEKHHEGVEDENTRYPHRMTVLRPELIESHRIKKLREYIGAEMERKKTNRTPSSDVDEPSNVGYDTAPENGITNGELTNGESSHSETVVSTSESGEEAASKDQHEANVKETPVEQTPVEQIDVSGFKFTLNPDVYSGQQPQTDEEKAELEADETEVRTICKSLLSEVIPRLVREMQEGDVGFPMDGQSLVREMHKRGINVRYLGELARLCDEQDDDKRVQALGKLCKQEMASRAFKHVANTYLRVLPACFAQSCVSHLLNCFLGSELNEKPQAEIDEDLKLMYPDVEFTFMKATPPSFKVEVAKQIKLRYRYELPVHQYLTQEGKRLQMLREVSLKLGFQLEAKEYQFSAAVPAPQTKALPETPSEEVPQTNGIHPPGEISKKKKKKQQNDISPTRAISPTTPPTTFRPENVLNIVPIVKEASPRSTLAEEALDAGRMGIQQEPKQLGQELLFESLSLHEQIYGILHPEVARVYHALSTIYFNLDEKVAAVELAKKAVIVSERTLGVDNAETVLAYFNLSLLEHGAGNTKNALAYVRHGMDLLKIVYGVRHPDSLTTLNNVAIMLQSLKQFQESRGWFEAALAMCEDVTGRPSLAIATATLLFQLAQSLAFSGDAKMAMAKMRESYSIFKAELGGDHQNTKEAETWLDTLTHAAVSQAKSATAMQNRKMLLRGNGRPSKMTLGGTKQPVPSASAPVPPTARPRGVDQRNVDELIKYINGEGAQSTPKKKPANPKRLNKKA